MSGEHFHIGAHRGTRRAATSVALLATAVVVGACGSAGTSRRPDRAAGSVDRQSRVPRQPDPRPGAHRRVQGLLPGRDAQRHDGQDDHIQRRPGRERGASRRHARRCVRRPRPGDQRLHQDQGQGADRRRHRVGRSRARGQQDHRRREFPGGSRRQDALVAAAREHPGHRAAQLAGDQGTRHQHQRRRPGDHRLELGQLGQPAELRSRQDRRWLGSRALRIRVHPPGKGHARR